MESPLSAWESFYVIVGSSAAALTGLQFVVIVLGSEMRTGGPQAVSAFGTPTVVHFCAALLVSVTLSAPWPSLAGAAWVLGSSGVTGILYGLRVLRHTQRQRDYRPVMEDWIWHNLLPLIAYATFLAAAFALPHRDTGALFAIAAATLLLLFIGIHNAWDAVTFIAQRGFDRSERRSPRDESHPRDPKHPRKDSR